MFEEYDGQEERIAQIFGGDEVPSVETDTLSTFYKYLKIKLELPCTLTGIEDMGCFSWEERFRFGYGSEKEYQKMRMTKPSYRDTYEFIQFDDIDDDFGILVRVKRVDDKKKFVLPLADLEATEKNTMNYQLIDDYVTWYVNYR